MQLMKYTTCLTILTIAKETNEQLQRQNCHK